MITMKLFFYYVLIWIQSDVTHFASQRKYCKNFVVTQNELHQIVSK